MVSYQDNIIQQMGQSTVTVEFNLLTVSFDSKNSFERFIPSLWLPRLGFSFPLATILFDSNLVQMMRPLGQKLVFFFFAS